MKTVLSESSDSRWAFCGKKVKFPQVKEKLCKYICDKRQYGFAISTEMCFLEAKKTVAELEESKILKQEKMTIVEQYKS